MRCLSWLRGSCLCAYLLLPGPSVLFVVTRSSEQGRRAGRAAVLGGALGNLVHIIATTLGVSAIVASPALAFVSGGVYLALGVSAALGGQRKSAR